MLETIRDPCATHWTRMHG